MSVPTVSLNRSATPSPLSRAATISGRVAWLSRVASCSGVCVESPTTRPSSAISVTRLDVDWPSRSASRSRAEASWTGDVVSSSAIRRASSVSRCSMASRSRWRTWEESSSATTTSETAAADTEATKILVRKLVFRNTPGCSAVGVALVDQLVPELLDRDEVGHERRQLFAQPPDMHVHRPRASSVAVAPDVAEQQVAGEYTVTVLQEVAQQHELLRREFYVLAVLGHRVRGEVDGQRSDREPGVLRFGAAHAPHERANAGDELIRAERLGNVVVGADFQSHDAVGLFGPGGDHDDRQAGGGPVGAEEPADLEAADARQHDVEDGDVHRLFARDGQGLVA